MRETRRPPRALTGRWTPLLLGILTLGILTAAALPTPACAQTVPEPGWAVVPMLGFGLVRDGAWGSAGMEAAVELEYGAEAWRGSGYVSQRGIGVGCSHACFDGGPALALGGSRSLGPLWVGGGAGVMKDFGEWRLVPFGRISVDAAPFRVDVRVELARESGWDLYLPVLIGLPLRTFWPGSG